MPFSIWNIPYPELWRHKNDGFQLRESRNWENIGKSYHTEYKKRYTVQEWESNLADELKPFPLSDEQAHILGKKNRATQIIGLQSQQLRELSEKGRIENVLYVEMAIVLKELCEHQGKSERIKNFPYPRQFAGPFKTGGLNGFPFTGLTGMEAFTHPVAEDGAVT